MNLKKIKFSPPTPKNPFYSLLLSVEGTLSTNNVVKKLRVNGVRTRDITIINDGIETAPGLYITAPSILFKDAKEHQILVRVDWEKGGTYQIEIDLEDENNNPIETITQTFTATEDYGYWNKNWKYYASHVLSENKGYDRVQEPVHVVLSMYADRMTNPEKELRVVEVHPESGATREVRSQVYSVSNWDKWANKNCQPSTTIQVAFMADVHANSEKVYLFFYGNPKADYPSYETDLSLSGSNYGLTIKNTFYNVVLNKDSGSIDEINPNNHPDISYCHKLETNGALQWNPCVYAPPKTWMHTSDWINPENFEVIVGPIFIMIKKFDKMPGYEEIDCSLTYIFYSHSPAIEIESNIDVLKELDVTALRNGSVVLNRETTGDFAWMGMDGNVGSVHITDLPRHPLKAKLFDAKTPWFAFYNKDDGNALGVLNLEFAGIRRSGGLIEWDPFFYLHWGPWYYISRPIIYAFTSNNPQRVMHMSAGTSFYERYQLMPFDVGQGDNEDEGFDQLQNAYAKAANPLSKTTAVLDTDERLPEEWEEPILVTHFEEMED